MVKTPVKPRPAKLKGRGVCENKKSIYYGRCLQTSDLIYLDREVQITTHLLFCSNVLHADTIITSN